MTFMVIFVSLFGVSILALFALGLLTASGFPKWSQWSLEPFDARETAQAIKCAFGLSERAVVKAVFVLGTGWGDTIRLENEKSIVLRRLPGFRGLPDHPTHQRKLCFGYLDGEPVFVLRGRIHMNEVPYSTKLANMVRLQIEMFRYLGVERFVLTAAVGGLVRGHGLGDQQAKTGTVGIADGFVTIFAPDMPLYGGEFMAVETTLDPRLRKLALEACSEVGLEGFEGGHVMVRGPQFEGTRYDKRTLAEAGAKMVGMSVLPEACVAALWDAKVLVLGFVSNDDVEAHSDELVQTRVKAAADKLGVLIKAINRRFKTL